MHAHTGHEGGAENPEFAKHLVTIDQSDKWLNDKWRV